MFKELQISINFSFKNLINSLASGALPPSPLQMQISNFLEIFAQIFKKILKKFDNTYFGKIANFLSKFQPKFSKIANQDVSLYLYISTRV